MKKFVLLSLVCFVGGVCFARYLPQKPSSVESIRPFAPSPYPLIQRPLVIVIIGKNNGAFVEKTLSSVFSQVYEPYRVVYIDDASEDGSYELARDLIYDSPHLPKVTLVHNEESFGFLANLFRAVESCEEDEIIAVLRGEDQLAHEWVLQKINQYYADPDLWITYGQYCKYPSFEKGICQPYQEENFRSEPFVASHLQTFYAGLFQKIETSDFLYEGNYFPLAEEQVYMIPMLEMAKGHWTYVPEVLYISSQKRQGDPELHAHCEKAIRALSMYSPLTTLSKKKGEE